MRVMVRVGRLLPVNGDLSHTNTTEAILPEEGKRGHPLTVSEGSEEELRTLRWLLWEVHLKVHVPGKSVFDFQ